MWRGMVASASRGKRGQAFFRELAAALDAMPVKELITEEIKSDGAVCAIGSILDRRGVSDLENVDATDHHWLAGQLDIATCLVQETEYQNDEGAWKETPAQRWTRIRKWAEKNIRKEPEQP